MFFTTLVGDLLIMLYIEYKSTGLFSLNFYIYIRKPVYWPCDLFMQSTGTIWTPLIWDYTPILIIPVKFGQNPISSVKGDAY